MEDSQYPILTFELTLPPTIMTPRFRIAQLASTVASCSTKQFRPPTAPFRRHASWRSGSSLYENAPFPQARRTSVLRPVNFLVCLVPIFTFSLGIWQVKRLRWKVDLIDEVQRNIEREPMVLPPNIKWVGVTTSHTKP